MFTSGISLRDLWTQWGTSGGSQGGRAEVLVRLQFWAGANFYYSSGCFVPAVGWNSDSSRSKCCGSAASGSWERSARWADDSLRTWLHRLAWPAQSNFNVGVHSYPLRSDQCLVCPTSNQVDWTTLRGDWCGSATPHWCRNIDSIL